MPVPSIFEGPNLLNGLVGLGVLLIAGTDKEFDLI